jgi:hypothetical protein
MRKIIGLMVMSWSAGAMGFPDTITVDVYNLSSAHARVIEKAEREAGRVFKLVDLTVRWVNCPPLNFSRNGDTCRETYDPSRFTIVISDTFANVPIKDTALGFAMPVSGARNHAAIVYARLKEFTNANSALIDYGSLLGAVLEHEIAHLLVASIRHGFGIMQANWTRAELKCIAQRNFLFTPEQGEALRAGLRSRIH